MKLHHAVMRLKAGNEGDSTENSGALRKFYRNPTFRIHDWRQMILAQFPTNLMLIFSLYFPPQTIQQDCCCLPLPDRHRQIDFIFH